MHDEFTPDRLVYLGQLLEKAEKHTLLLHAVEDLRKEMHGEDVASFLFDLAEALELSDAGVIGYPLTDEGTAAYAWCLHCERAETQEKWNAATRCPYADCDGTVIDRWSWERVRENIDGAIRYPEAPEVGKVYPLN